MCIYRYIVYSNQQPQLDIKVGNLEISCEEISSAPSRKHFSLFLAAQSIAYVSIYIYISPINIIHNITFIICISVYLRQTSAIYIFLNHPTNEKKSGTLRVSQLFGDALNVFQVLFGALDVLLLQTHLDLSTSREQENCNLG